MYPIIVNVMKVTEVLLLNGLFCGINQSRDTGDLLIWYFKS